MAAATGAVASAIPIQNVFGKCSHSGCACIASNYRHFQGCRVSSRISACAKSAGVISSTSALATALTEPSSTGEVASTANEAIVASRWRASIDFKWIRENKEAVVKNIKIRNSEANVDLVIELYEQYCDLTVEVNKLREERNVVANSMKRSMESSKREELVEKGKHLKERLAAFESELAVLLEKLQEEGQRLPNMTHPDVPLGSEEAAVVDKVVGSKVELGFPARDHLELGQLLDLFDFGAAAEVSGQKFYYLKNEAVLLELALVSWALAEVIKKGFVPLSTPDLVRSTVVEKCGFQPRGQNTQIYSVEGTDLCLAGTAEIPVAGMYMDKIVPDSSLPSKLVAFSHCFRTEAGAAGSATRGLYRVHQFSKVEMFIFCRPEESDAFHKELISIEEELYTSLGLHFNIIDMPTEDLGAPAYRKYDVEAWMPGLGRYGEISSASNCTDYQSRRLNIRYRPATEEVQASKLKKGKQPTRFVHTLNATACAVPRLIVAILENFQQQDGSVLVPDVLQPYMGGLKEFRIQIVRRQNKQLLTKQQKQWV